MSDRPVVVLLSTSSKKGRRWRELLAGVDCEVVSHTKRATDSTIDVVITDSQQQLESAMPPREPIGNYGVIAIEAEVASADVIFSNEPSPRELRLACDLLSQIARLRREHHASQQTQQMLTKLAELDALTHLANRRAWNAELARRIQQVGNADETLCLALFDLDHFKQINTSYGFAIGDQVLQRAGRALQTSVRSEDFVARIGGDEFGVLLSNVSAAGAETVVERIRARVTPSLEPTDSVVITATAGLSLCPPHDDTASLFAAADSNLRRGKAAGRNQTVASG